jgi:hypothetical protein
MKRIGPIFLARTLPVSPTASLSLAAGAVNQFFTDFGALL